MKAFFLKVLAICTVVALLLGLLNYAFLQADTDERDAMSDVTKFKKVPSGIQICNLGSSHGRDGFNYSNHQDRVCFNFAVSAQSLVYDSRILEYYKKNMAPGATVFILASYFSFYGIPEDKEEGFNSKNMRYYTFLPPRYITDFDPAMIIWSRFPVLRQYEKLVTMAREQILRKKSNNKSINTYTDNGQELSIDYSALEKIGLKTAEEHVSKTHVDENGSLITRQESIDAVYDMIKTCREIGARPILLTMPYTKYYVEGVEKITPGFFENYHSIIMDIIEKTGIEYYDYSRDTRFYEHPELFRDTDHLNTRGSELFTDILFDEVI